MRISNARMVAYEVLRDVIEKDAYANLALQSMIRQAELTEQNAAFATELTSGTLRLQGLYNAIIEIAAKRPTEQIDSKVLTVLQLGAHQLLSLSTATHAALNEQVELSKKVAGHRTAGFVNGVLRTISRTSFEDWQEQIKDRAQSAKEALSILHSHPLWIVEALEEALKVDGLENELEDTLIANNESPRVQLAVLEGNKQAIVHEDKLRERGASPIGVELLSGNPSRMIDKLDRKGVRARVQDQGSQLAALALTKVRDIRTGEEWLDLCAGPGGKTAVLAAQAKRSGAHVWANEISPHRTKLVRDSIEGFEDTVTVVSHDGRTAEAFGARKYDRILVDAPCSGLGALRRRPEARWRKAESDLTDLTTLQWELIQSAAQHLKPGGVLAYVTCSPHVEETRAITERFAAEHPEMTQLDARQVVNEAARNVIDFGASKSLTAQLWPHRDNTDAMSISLFQLEK